MPAFATDATGRQTTAAKPGLEQQPDAALTPDSDQPPLGEWEQLEAIRALAEFAVDLTAGNGDEAWRRLGRLTAEQRQWVLDRVDEGDDEPDLPSLR